MLCNLKLNLTSTGLTYNSAEWIVDLWLHVAQCIIKEPLRSVRVVFPSLDLFRLFAQPGHFFSIGKSVLQVIPPLPVAVLLAAFFRGPLALRSPLLLVHSPVAMYSSPSFSSSSPSSTPSAVMHGQSHHLTLVSSFTDTLQHLIPFYISSPEQEFQITVSQKEYCSTIVHANIEQVLIV